MENVMTTAAIAAETATTVSPQWDNNFDMMAMGASDVPELSTGSLLPKGTWLIVFKGLAVEEQLIEDTSATSGGEPHPRVGEKETRYTLTMEVLSHIPDQPYYLAPEPGVRRLSPAQKKALLVTDQAILQAKAGQELNIYASTRNIGLVWDKASEQYVEPEAGKEGTKSRIPYLVAILKNFVTKEEEATLPQEAGQFMPALLAAARNNMAAVPVDHEMNMRGDRWENNYSVTNKWQLQAIPLAPADEQVAPPA